MSGELSEGSGLELGLEKADLTHQGGAQARRGEPENVGRRVGGGTSEAERP